MIAVRFLGTTDEVTSCDCCGRKDLKSTVALELDDATVYYGVVCAARALGRTPKSIRDGARAADKAVADAKEAARRADAAVEDARWQAYLNAAAPSVPRAWDGKPDRLRQIAQLGGFAAARDGYLAVKAAS